MTLEGGVYVLRSRQSQWDRNRVHIGRGKQLSTRISRRSLTQNEGDAQVTNVHGQGQYRC